MGSQCRRQRTLDGLKRLLLCESQVQPLRQAHCHLGLGTLYTRSGQLQQAHAELSAATEIYRAMDMTFWLPQLEVAQAQIEERP